MAALAATAAPASQIVPASAEPCGARPPAPSQPRVVLQEMSEAQRVGQLFMVGTPAGARGRTVAAGIARYHVGNVMFTGRTSAGRHATAPVAAGLQGETTGTATSGVRLLIATDFEGGAVQVIRGPGLSSVPSARTQREYSRSGLRHAAGRWARQLRSAGVNMDLAPVMDTVPGPAAAPGNAPVGAFGREYGFTPQAVAGHGTAFAAGMDRNGVVPTIKHFPGLGRVRSNTDTTAGVTDRVTHRHDSYLQPFHAAIASGHAPFVMMSTAYYPRLDPRHPAAFSRFIIGRVLRGDLGFHGAVISDDLGTAREVAAWPPGQRATRFIGAGGDMVLTVDPATLPAMYRSVLSLARSDAAFRRMVDAAALRVLRVKARYHLLGPRPPLADPPMAPPQPLPTWLRGFGCPS